MSSKDRLLQYLDYNGIRKSEFYKKTGLSNGFLDKNANISSDKIEIIISKIPGINLQWLITGQGEMLTTMESNGNTDSIKQLIAVPPSVGIPLIPIDAMAGFMTGNSEQTLEYECVKYVIPAFRDAEFLISVRGSSMYPKYNSGDIVACRKVMLGKFFQWNKVYVLDTEQGVLIKRIHESDKPNSIKLMSDNSQYKPFDVDISDIYSIAIVVGVIRVE